MKKRFVFFLSLIAAQCVTAQPDYPSAPPASPNLVRLEYFIDVDPGVGNGNQLLLGPSQQVSAFNFDAALSGVSNGLHRIYIRTLDENGRWSHTGNSFFDKFLLPAYAIAPPALKNIVEAEYFLDNDPGLGNGTEITLPLTTDVINENIVLNLVGLTPSVHRLYVRVKTSDGLWSITNISSFDNSNLIPYPNAAAPAPSLAEMEYYFDNDPGFGNATPIPITAGADISYLSIDIPVGSLAAGRHTIYIRSRQNPWSLNAYMEFFMSSLLPVNWLYVKAESGSNGSTVSWATVNEENNKVFVVEHSTDGRSFIAVGEVAATVISNSSQSYSFNHNHPSEGFNYYRLKQVDIDGKFSYSKVVTLFNGHAQTKTFIGPNPVQDLLHIVEPNEIFLRSILLYDMQGRMVMRKNFDKQARVFSLPVAFLPGGQYLLKLVYRDKIRSFSIKKD